MQNAIPVEVIYVVCDRGGCPRFAFDLSPSGYHGKTSSPNLYNKIAIPIDPITVLMNPNMLEPWEIASLGWPPALASTLALLNSK